MASTSSDAMRKLVSSCLIRRKVNKVYCSSLSYLFDDGTKDLSQRLDAEQQNMSILAKSNKKIALALAQYPDKLLHSGQGSCKVDRCWAYNAYKFSEHNQLHYGRQHREHSTKCGSHGCVSTREVIEKRVELKPKRAVFGNRKTQPYKLSLKNESPAAVEKIVHSEKQYGHDNVGDANEESQYKLDFTMRTAISDATADLHAAVITDAVMDILSKNDIEGHSKIVIGFSVGEKAVIADYLSEGLAEFAIQILFKSGPQKATIRLYRKYFQVFVQNKRLFFELYSRSPEIRIKKGSQFVLKLSNGSSYMCDTEGDFILRDKIVVTAEAFLKKVSLFGEGLPSWTKPPTGWLKLNTKGRSSYKEVGGIGGLIRDDSGTWVSGFLGQVTIVDDIELQLEALKRGLCLAQKVRGAQKIIVETDRSIVMYLLADSTQLHLAHPYFGLRFECKQLLKELGESDYKFVHIERSSNSSSADRLANMGLESVKMEVKILDTPPDILRLFLLYDNTVLPSYMHGN